MSAIGLCAVPKHCHWGYFDRALPPRLTIDSGDTVAMETVTSKWDPDGEMIDDGVRRLFAELQDRGPGPHLLTGPVAIRDAEPGDALEIHVEQLALRVPVAVNAHTPNGLLASEFDREWIGTVFDAHEHFASARYRFAYPDPRPQPGEPLVVTRRVPVANMTIPQRLHLGIAAVAPDVEGRVDTMAPGRFGGNFDQWRFTTGTSMFFPVLVPGALFSCGDGHLFQGDGEITGMGGETHLNATLRFILHKRRAIGNFRLQTPHATILHGLGRSLEEAFLDAAREAVAFLADSGRDPVDAYTLAGLGVDFGVTQFVNGVRGAHAIVPHVLHP